MEKSSFDAGPLTSESDYLMNRRNGIYQQPITSEINTLEGSKIDVCSAAAKGGQS